MFPLSQAEKKGASSSEYGLVFGIFELVVFIVSPVYGQHVGDDIIIASVIRIRCNFKIATKFQYYISEVTSQSHR